MDLVKVNKFDINLSRKKELKLLSSLVIPSSVHALSVSVEYMKKWFLSKFNENYFKPESIYVDGKHIFDDMRRFDKTKVIKRTNPALAIFPVPDYTFDRESIDQNLGGLDLYVRRSSYEDSFFKDYDHKLFIQSRLEANLINFVFKVRLDTRAQQIDLYKFMKLAFRVGATQGEYIDIDLHVPLTLMLQLAYDAGFKVDLDNKRVLDNISFLQYLNKRSEVPFLYKLRCINGRDEYFIRIEGLYTHIRATEINLDEGERIGQIDTNFTIEMNAELRIPAPQSFIYFSKTENLILESIEKEEKVMIGLHTIKVADLPEMNEKKWNRYIKTEYDEEDLSKPLSIDLSTLFTGDFKTILDYTKELMISPSAYMDIKLYNGGYEKELIVDWEKNTITTKEKMEYIRSVIGIYVDLEYMNSMLIAAKEMYSERFQKEKKLE